MSPMAWREMGTHILLAEMWIDTAFGKSNLATFIKLKVHKLFNLAIPLLRLQPPEIKAFMYKDRAPGCFLEHYLYKKNTEIQENALHWVQLKNSGVSAARNIMQLFKKEIIRTEDLNIYLHQNHLEVLLKFRLLKPITRVSNSVDLEWSLRICF